MSKPTLTVQTTVAAPIDVVWEYWNKPEHITNWATGSVDWHTPAASNDLREGGSFTTTMAAKDGSQQFDFSGTYTQIKKYESIAYTAEDGREVMTTFSQEGDGVHIVQTFEPESENTLELQQSGWQSILNNFKKYVESR